MTVARRPLTQLGYISEAVSRFNSVPGVTAKKAVFKEQSYERGLDRRQGSVKMQSV
jgi:hypothetical protein